jgi:hypothetical protein
MTRNGARTRVDGDQRTRAQCVRVPATHGNDASKRARVASCYEFIRQLPRSGLVQQAHAADAQEACARLMRTAFGFQVNPIMSWWVYGKDKSGKRVVWEIDIDFMQVVFVLGLLVTFFVPALLRGPLAIFADGIRFISAGLACVIVSKISLFRRGIWVSWGPRVMSKWWARLYKVGYALIAIGIFLVLVAHGRASHPNPPLYPTWGLQQEGERNRALPRRG